MQSNQVELDGNFCRSEVASLVALITPESRIECSPDLERCEEELCKIITHVLSIDDVLLPWLSQEQYGHSEMNITMHIYISKALLYGVSSRSKINSPNPHGKRCPKHETSSKAPLCLCRTFFS